MKKVLLCTNQYNLVANGPVKFAHLLVHTPLVEVRILSEDLTDDQLATNTRLYKLPISTWQKKNPLSQLIRMWLYHREAMRIRQTFAFDVLLFNHALTGLWSACFFSRTIGMINDDQYMKPFSKTHRGWLGRFRYWTFRWLEKQVYHRSDKVIVNSMYLKETILHAYGFKKQVYVLYKGVEPVQYRLQPPHFKEPIQLLFVKSDFQTGGLQDLLEALALVKFRFQLHVVGASPQLQDYLEKTSVQKLLTNVIVHGYLSILELEALTSNIDIVCIPSHREALGVTNMEALSRGISVITTHVGGSSEVVDQGKCGWLVEVANPVQLANALDECVNNAPLRNRKRQHGLTHVAKFSVSNMYESFERIVNQA